MRWLILAIIAGVGIFIGAAAYFKLIELPWVDSNAITDKTAPKVELGGDLYKVEESAKLDRTAVMARREPLILKGTLENKDKQEVPSTVAGQILFVGVPVPDGVVEAAGSIPFMAEPFAYNTVTVGDATMYKFYRRLLPGQVVQSEQIVGMVDCSKAIAGVQEKTIKIAIAEKKEKSAKAAADEAKSRYDREYQLFLNKGSSPADLSAAEAAKWKFYYDHLAEVATVSSTRNELDQARLYYSLHEIRNKVQFERCMIQYVYKHRGDAVKEQETVMVVHSLDYLLATAQIEESQLDRITPEMTATLEPTRVIDPRVFPSVHKGEVTGVAFTNDTGAPRVVSAGVDKIVSVRDTRPLDKDGTGEEADMPLTLRHHAAVHGLACSPVGAPHNFCISGAGDKIYVWDLDRKTIKKALDAGHRIEPIKEFANAAPDSATQAPQVTCIAFSPDGAYFATGADDGSIAIWHTSRFQLVYRFDAEHGVDHPHTDPVTSLTFTPQCQLISAGRDNTVRVWNLKEKGAVMVGEPMSRGGTVAQLGVDSKGRWLLLDRTKDLQFISLVQPGLSVATLQNPGTNTPFETLAQFSPDGNLLLTSGLGEGRLQLWKTPTEKARGFEVRQFVTKEKLPATCAAFDPRAAQGGLHAQAASGNGIGDVYLWPLPTLTEVDAHRIKHVPVRLLARSLDPNTHQARIAVDVPNPASTEHPLGRLVPGRSVTIVIGDND